MPVLLSTWEMSSEFKDSLNYIVRGRKERKDGEKQGRRQ